jgi:hypothetical protein
MKSVIKQVVDAIDKSENRKLSHVTYNGEDVIFHTDASQVDGSPKLGLDPAYEWLQKNGSASQGNTPRKSQTGEQDPR